MQQDVESESCVEVRKDEKRNRPRHGSNVQVVEIDHEAHGTVDGINVELG